ncbi:related to F-LANa protein [Fusarium torulosum]|uniref:Derlin n=1 Tax=Fusarium torulosum TaxID=33205 RepID=A0AAE8MGE0_9HYPO|nr:related to F-LANa protein [Fusarium torulosum]
MADNVMAAYWDLPPVSRNITTAVVLTSIGCIVGLLPTGLLIHHPSYLWMFPPQIWRLVTSFFIELNPLNLLFNAFFLYRYCTQLELGNPRFPRKVDLIYYILFVSFVILMIDYLAGLTSFMYMNGLILAMVYTISQDQRGQKTQYLVLTIPAQALPICMIVVAALMAGPSKAIVEVEGLLAAHLYDFLTRIWPEFGNGPRLLRIPAWLERLAQTPRVLPRAFGTAVRPANTASTGSSTGANTGPLPDSWRTRGPGKRLG